MDSEDSFELKERLAELEQRKNPAPVSMLRYFEYDHLPENLQGVSKEFRRMAKFILTLPATDERERQVALRKLLEAKDAAVRSVIPEDM